MRSAQVFDPSAAAAFATLVICGATALRRRGKARARPARRDGDAAPGPALQPATVRLDDSREQDRALKSLAGESFACNGAPGAGRAAHEVPFSLVDDPDALRDVMRRFAAAPVLGIDIEHHRMFSYYDGKFTALIDAVALRRHMYGALRDVMLSESVVKVLHAPSNDLLWLQRDFGLLAANVFNTQEAEAQLGSPACSLTTLWARYTDHRMAPAEKRALQASDWRQRPLSLAQLEYAAADAALLPRVFAAQVAALDRAGVSHRALRKHAEALCRRRYAAPAFDAAAALRRFLQGMGDARARWSREQAAQVEGAFLAAMRWREDRAQSLDVSVTVLAPWRLLLALAAVRAPTAGALRRRLADWRAAQPGAAAPTLVERHLGELASVLRSAEPVPLSEAPDPGQPTPTPGTAESRAEVKARRTQRQIKLFSAKRPVYEGCRMVAPNGAMLCFCDRKKARWYLSKGLAEVAKGSWEEMVKEGKPLTIRLTFEPNTKEVDTEANQFYLQQRDNRCVVCGHSDHFMRFHVIPRCYRQHFPESHKSHRSHDIVLLCLHCHNAASQHADRVRERIARETGIPVHPPVPDAPFAQQLAAARGAGVALVRSAHKMPVERATALRRRLLALLASVMRDELLPRLESTAAGRRAPPPPVPTPSIARGKFRAAEDTEAGAWAAALAPEEAAEIVGADLLRWVAALKPPPVHAAVTEHHGRLVVAQLDDLEEFVRMWRREFVESMRPRFLPPQWGVNHQITRSFGERSVFRGQGHEEEDGPTRFKGVRRRGEGRFEASLALPDGTLADLGVFPTAEDAARAYNVRARQAYGVSAVTNDVGDD